MTQGNQQLQPSIVLGICCVLPADWNSLNAVKWDKPPTVVALFLAAGSQQSKRASFCNSQIKAFFSHRWSNLLTLNFLCLPRPYTRHCIHIRARPLPRNHSRSIHKHNKNITQFFSRTMNQKFRFLQQIATVRKHSVHGVKICLLR